MSTFLLLYVRNIWFNVVSAALILVLHFREIYCRSYRTEARRKGKFLFRSIRYENFILVVLVMPEIQCWAACVKPVTKKQVFLDRFF